MSFVKELSMDSGTATNRLATGEPVSKEQRFELLSIKGLSNNDENGVVRSMDYALGITKQK